MNYAHPAVVGVRRLGQRLGVLKPAQRLYRRLFRVAYEQAFDQAMTSEVRPGDVVWDVGANVGFYTRQFSDLAGPSGKVLGFEPSPPVFEELMAAVGARANCRPVQAALSDVDGTAMFDVRAHGHVGRLSDTGSAAVDVKRGDHFIDQGRPDIVKIDVEGFELEVLRGMPEALASVRAVFIEVHFTELMQRGLTGAPREIETLLGDAGLTTRWIDPSHIQARRR